MANERVTSLKDVARAAGVSVATVSRLLNGSLELPAETEKRIKEAIRTLNYAPTRMRGGCSLGRSDTIGLVVPDIANPFFAYLVAAVEAAADRSGLGVVALRDAEPAGPRDRLSSASRAQPCRRPDLRHQPSAMTARSPSCINRTGGSSSSTRTCPARRRRSCSATTRQGGRLAGGHWSSTGIGACFSSAAGSG